MPATAEKWPLAELDAAALRALSRAPEGEVRGTLGGIPYSARIAIPNYGERIARHYRDIAPDGLSAACASAEIPFDLPRFGLVVSFADAAELAIHDDAMVLDGAVRDLVGRFGPVIFRNARIVNAVRERCHRNIFPHLRFHVDRGAAMPNQFSCFTRDPLDPEQRPPRASSTLFMANIVAWLETVRTLACKPGDERGVRPSYDLFDGLDMAPMLGETVLEQPWSEPDGTGEIAVIDNRTLLHATYHKDGTTKGYRIGARYLV